MVFLSEYDIKLVHLPGSKMILFNTLSWWPDFVSEKDTNNEDIVLLPDWLFVNLINIKLQREIANTDNLNIDATTAIMLFLGKGPIDLKKDLSNWTTEDFEGKSIKERTIFQKITILGKRSSPNTMTYYLLDILVKLRPLMLSRSIIGGQGCRPSSKTMSRDVAYANNSRSTGTICIFVQPNTWTNNDLTICKLIYIRKNLTCLSAEISQYMPGYIRICFD